MKYDHERTVNTKAHKEAHKLAMRFLKRGAALSDVVRFLRLQYKFIPTVLG